MGPSPSCATGWDRGRTAAQLRARPRRPDGRNAFVDGKMMPPRPSSRSSCIRSAAQSIVTTFKRLHTHSRPSHTTACPHRHRRRHLSHPPSRAPPTRPPPSRNSPLAYLRPRVTFAQFQHRAFPPSLSRPHSLSTVRIFCWAEADLFLGFYFGRPPPSSVTAHSSPRSTIASRRFTARCNLSFFPLR